MIVLPLLVECTINTIMVNPDLLEKKHSIVRSYINNSTINVYYISTNDNIADPLTKTLAREKVWIASRGMGLKPKEE